MSDFFFRVVKYLNDNNINCSQCCPFNSFSFEDKTITAWNFSIDKPTNELLFTYSEAEINRTKAKHRIEGDSVLKIAYCMMKLGIGKLTSIQDASENEIIDSLVSSCPSILNPF